MYNTKHLLISSVLSALIIIFGTIGYMAIEDWTFIDAFYMTVITIATVGYGEIHRVSNIGRLFTILIIFLGVGFSMYVAGVIVQLMVEGQIRAILGRKRLNNKINHLKRHHIICGYGRIGQVLCNHVRNTSIDFMVIEKNDDMIPTMETDEILFLTGDATDETVLLKARIKEAKGLVAVLDTDAQNVFLVLTARQLNPNLFIIARSCESRSKSKLLAAGANSVESPYDMGAMIMAQRIIRPTVTNFLNLALASQPKEIQMEEIPITPASHLVNVMLKDSGIRSKYNLIIIAIKKDDGQMNFNPSFDTLIEAHDTVIAIGEAVNLQRLDNVLNPDC
ncbi:potassium channel protein [Desulfococcaceae bacterium HSG7]|nr:potassium channel protein [Desulfococcaceae bacterium HSG9]MDM8555758.1 potassium channel protein [Desulfococcaceae bacterium HSG7]